LEEVIKAKGHRFWSKKASSATEEPVNFSSLENCHSVLTSTRRNIMHNLPNRSQGIMGFHHFKELTGITNNPIQVTLEMPTPLASVATLPRLQSMDISKQIGRCTGHVTYFESFTRGSKDDIQAASNKPPIPPGRPPTVRNDFAAA
jgi:hypothetical protein